MDVEDSTRPNSLIIHYTSNNHIVRPDETILIDAGCEYKYDPYSLLHILILTSVPLSGYASDISKQISLSTDCSDAKTITRSPNIPRLGHLHAPTTRALCRRPVRTEAPHLPLH